METKIDVKRILIFLAFAFGIAWACGLVIYLTGGLVNSPVLFGNFTLALVLLATLYMGAPTLANILTRLVTREGWADAKLRPQFKRGWPYWLAMWFLPGILTFIGAGVFFLVFPQFFDPELTQLTAMLEASAAAAGQAIPAINPWLIVLVQSLQGLLISPLINGLFTFGEEFGWRAYLQPKLMPLGGRKAMLLMGLIWGVWHAPAILMGHNYGLNYPGAPWLGPLAMIWFCFVIGTMLGWATLKAGSVWPAVIGHAAINGIAAIGALFVTGNPNPLLGPTPVGLLASIGFSLLTLVVFLLPNGLKEAELNS